MQLWLVFVVLAAACFAVGLAYHLRDRLIEEQKRKKEADRQRRLREEEQDRKDELARLQHEEQTLQVRLKAEQLRSSIAQTKNPPPPVVPKTREGRRRRYCRWARPLRRAAGY